MADVFSLTGPLGDLTGDFEGYKITGVYLECTEKALVNSDTGALHVASGKQMDVDAETGVASLSGIPSSVDASWLPGGQQYRLEVHYLHHRTGVERKWPSGYFPIDEDKTFATLNMGLPTVVDSEIYESVIGAANRAEAAAETAEQLSTSDGQTANNLENGPLSQAVLLGTFAELKAWAKNPDQLVAGAITYASGLLSTAAVEWPDGKPGILTITSRQASTGAVTGYTITRVVSGVTTTYTQPTITRDSSGAATLVPQITVA